MGTSSGQLPPQQATQVKWEPADQLGCPRSTPPVVQWTLGEMYSAEDQVGTCPRTVYLFDGAGVCGFLSPLFLILTINHCNPMHTFLGISPFNRIGLTVLLSRP